METADTDLLACAHRDLPGDLRARYDALRARLVAGTIDAREHAELLHLTAEVERLQAERVQALCELARRRGTSLEALMIELEIDGPADGDAG